MQTIYCGISGHSPQVLTGFQIVDAKTSLDQHTSSRRALRLRFISHFKYQHRLYDSFQSPFSPDHGMTQNFCRLNRDIVKTLYEIFFPPLFCDFCLPHMQLYDRGQMQKSVMHAQPVLPDTQPTSSPPEIFSSPVCQSVYSSLFSFQSFLPFPFPALHSLLYFSCLVSCDPVFVSCRVQ